jgi:quercetin dioxygenase-like cupin family protein
MKKILLTLGGLVLAAGLAAGVIWTQFAGAQQDPVKRTVLFKTEVEGLQGKEINLLMVELAPGAESGKHTHPGDEIAYVVSGSGTFDIEGKKPSTVKSGALVHLTPKQVHNVKNTGKTPFKALVLGIYAKGEPVATPVK